MGFNEAPAFSIRRPFTALFHSVFRDLYMILQVGGYRDLMLCVLFEGESKLRIVGEIQIHDAALHALKLKVLRLQTL